MHRMLRNAARALLESRDVGLTGWVDDMASDPMEEVRATGAIDLVAAARTVLAAFREPNAEMIDAGVAAARQRDADVLEEDVRVIFRSMISSVLDGQR